jgi:hypothetical protein
MEDLTFQVGSGPLHFGRGLNVCTISSIKLTNAM